MKAATNVREFKISNGDPESDVEEVCKCDGVPVLDLQREAHEECTFESGARYLGGIDDDDD
eukprot:10098505-Heterocapsa_arctica.AAC.1